MYKTNELSKMKGKDILSDSEELFLAMVFEPEKLWKLWKDKGNLRAALYLARKYQYGNEGNGIFRNPDKAREIYEEIGESYEEYEEKEKEPPNEAHLNIKGKSEEMERLKNLLTNMNETYGDPGDEEINFKVKYLMDALVKSPYYDGEIIGVGEVNKEKIKIMVRMEKPYALLFALRKVFPELKIRKHPENNSFIF